jgi:hypothetical protein
MRALVLAVVIGVSGCGGTSPTGSGGNGGNGGSAGGGGGGSHMLGGSGASCTTACDCQPGLGCNQSKCGNGAAPAYYCCDTLASCPGGSACQSASGALAHCGDGSGGSGGGGGGGSGGGGGGGGMNPDGGLGGFCQYIPCSSASACTQFGCTTCGGNGKCM